MTFPGNVRDACRRLHEGDEGVSLVEALVAVLILSTAMLALVATAATSTVSLRLSRDRQQAVQTASAALEDVRSMRWTAVALAPIPAPPASFEGETTVVLPSTSPLTPVAHVVTSPDGRFTTTTYITWANAEKTLKRVTAITSWSDRGQRREVRESTLVAIAERGLPVPNFLVTPETSTQQYVTGSAVCFKYSLVNLGEKDSYSYQAGQTASGTFTPGERRTGYTFNGVQYEGFKVTDIAGGPWFVWARLGEPVAGVSPLMKDVTGDLRPDSAGPVERRATVPVEFCAVPHTDSGGQSQTPSFTFRLYSAFDDRVLRDATGVVSETVALDRLYLVTGGSNPRTKYELTRTKPLRTLVTFDPDSPSDGLPGLRFRPGNQSQDVANWDYQPGSSRIEGTATLTLFVANGEIRSGTDDGRDETIGLRLRIQKLNSQRNQVMATVFDGPVDIPESELRSRAVGGWALHRLSFAVPTTSFAANEYLRLSLWDHSATDDDNASHLHFDVNENGAGDDPASYGGGGGENERFMSNLSIRVVPQ